MAVVAAPAATEPGVPVELQGVTVSARAFKFRAVVLWRGTACCQRAPDSRVISHGWWVLRVKESMSTYSSKYFRE